jgi:SAM-dependent methyltransferase
MASVAQALFHAVCVKEYARPASYDENYYARGFDEIKKFLRIFDGQVEFRGKSVLDIGCGHGSACVHLAINGAEHVVGIDPDHRRVELGRRRLAEDYPELVGRVELVVGHDLSAVEGRRFDLIISKDTFEHIPEPVTYTSRLKQHLTDGGLVAIGFGPLFRSLYGGHISYMTRLPWAHLLFPESVIMAERRRFRPGEQVSGFTDFVNKITLGEFVGLMRRGGLACASLRTNVSPKRSARLFDLLRRVPLCGDLFTVNVYSTWRAG